MREKPGGAGVPVSIGTMADATPPGSDYDVAYVVFNTFFANLSQREQVRGSRMRLVRCGRAGAS